MGWESKPRLAWMRRLGRCERLLIGVLAVLALVWCVCAAERAQETRRYAALCAPRQVDKESPIFGFAKLLQEKNWEWGRRYRLAQCDGVPSVYARGRQGYRILLWENKNRNHALQQKEVVLFPLKCTVSEGLKNAINWTETSKYVSSDSAFYMGQGHGYHWFGQLSVEEQEWLRQSLGLDGGGDRFALLMEHIKGCRDDREEAGSTLQLLVNHGEKSIPFLTTEARNNALGCRAIAFHSLAKLLPEDESVSFVIEEAKKDTLNCRTLAIRRLGSIHGEASTETLLELYENEETKEMAAQALTSGWQFRPEAKTAYLNILQNASPESGGRLASAAARFGWQEALPSIIKLREASYEPSHYLDYTLATRHLEAGVKFETALEVHHDALRSSGPAGSHAKGRKQDLIQGMTSSPDVETATLLALQSYLVCNKGIDYRENSLKILRTLPEEVVNRTINELLNRPQPPDSNDRNSWRWDRERFVDVKEALEESRAEERA